MDIQEREAKINFLNWFGKVVGVFGLMAGDIPIWFHQRSMIELTDEELDRLFRVRYDYCELNKSKNEKEREWDVLCEEVLSEKVMSKARTARFTNATVSTTDNGSDSA